MKEGSYSASELQILSKMYFVAAVKSYTSTPFNASQERVHDEAKPLLLVNVLAPCLNEDAKGAGEASSDFSKFKKLESEEAKRRFIAGRAKESAKGILSFFETLPKNTNWQPTAWGAGAFAKGVDPNLVMKSVFTGIIEAFVEKKNELHDKVSITFAGRASLITEAIQNAVTSGLISQEDVDKFFKISGETGAPQLNEGVLFEEGTIVASTSGDDPSIVPHSLNRRVDSGEGRCGATTSLMPLLMEKEGVFVPLCDRVTGVFLRNVMLPKEDVKSRRVLLSTNPGGRHNPWTVERPDGQSAQDWKPSDTDAQRIGFEEFVSLRSS
jgi:hypothetical protein